MRTVNSVAGQDAGQAAADLGRASDTALSGAEAAIQPSHASQASQVGADGAGGTWMEEPDAPLASTLPPASAPEGSGGTWMERTDEAVGSSTPVVRELVATQPAEVTPLPGPYPGDTASDAEVPLEPNEPHDAPAEGRSLDLPGADRDETLDDVVVGDEGHASNGDLGGQPAAEVGLSDEGDRELGEAGQADGEALGDVPDREDILGDTPPGATNYMEAAAPLERHPAEAEPARDQAPRSLPDDPDAEMDDSPGWQGDRARE